MSEKLKTVVVDRARWARGGCNPASRLKVVGHDMYCCLGFCGLEAGYTPRQLAGRGFPAEVGDKGGWRESFPALLTEKAGDSVIGRQLAETNDALGTSPRVREAALKRQGKKAGIRFKFIGK